MMKRPIGLITALLLLFARCAPVKSGANSPAGEPGTSSGAGRIVPEEPARRVTRAFTDAGLPVFTQRIASVDFSASPPGTGGASVNLAELKGKVVFLNFWATWCGPCRAEMPSMEALYRRFKAEGLEILAVNYRENEQTIDAFMEQLNLSFPAALDLSGRINELYGIRAFPTTYIIDREGKIVTRVVGSLNWNTPELFAAFEALLDS
jgi:thiol-disulfide isomerase/thioredoxin